MSKLTIHIERLAIRCDLCHQNDLFDPNRVFLNIPHAHQAKHKEIKQKV